MEKISTDVRLRYLSVSGGWLGKVVINTANTLGIHDASVLSVFAVVWYLVVRISMGELAVVLGLYLDTVIPLQYYHDEEAYAAHKTHLDDYWPIFFIATAAEAGMYVLLDSTAFTLVVCLKSLALSFVWMGRKEDGTFLSTAFSGKSAPSSIPIGGMEWTTPMPPFWIDPRHPDAEKQLRVKYTDPLTRWGMMYDLCNTKSNSAQRLNSWLDEPYSKSRAKRMSDTAKKVIASGAQQPSTSLTHPSNLTPPEFPVDPRFPEVEQQLRSKFPDAWTRWGMVNALKKEPDDRADGRLHDWLNEPAKEQERGTRFAEAARLAVAALPLSQRTPANVQNLKVVPPLINRMGMDLARIDQMLRPIYSDAAVRLGVLETYRGYTNEDQAEHVLQHLAGSEAAEFRLRGQAAKSWRYALKDSRVPVFVEKEMMEWNERFKALYKDPWVRYGMLTNFLQILPSKREAKAKAICEESTLDKVSARIQSYSKTGRTMRDLFDDEGWVVRQGRADKWNDQDVETGIRGGRGVELAGLKSKMKAAKMRIGEIAKVLEVLSRPRCQSQEDAVVARLAAHRIPLVLADEEKAASVRRYATQLDPNIATFLAERLSDHSLSLDSAAYINKERAIELLKAQAHTKEDMVKVGKIIGDLGFGMAVNTKTDLAIEPKELLDLELKLMKLYGDAALVQAMMAQVTRARTVPLATERANLPIELGNDQRQAEIRDAFQGQVGRLEVMRAELEKHFDPGVVRVMKTDILAKEPEQRDAVFQAFLQIGQSGREAERYAATVAECKKRAVDDEYYQEWKPRGKLVNLLASIKEKVKPIFQ